jgi:capsule polysaccharide export protein KpsC/LpsZ
MRSTMAPWFKFAPVVIIVFIEHRSLLKLVTKCLQRLVIWSDVRVIYFCEMTNYHKLIHSILLLEHSFIRSSNIPPTDVLDISHVITC